MVLKSKRKTYKGAGGAIYRTNSSDSPYSESPLIPGSRLGKDINHGFHMLLKFARELLLIANSFSNAQCSDTISINALLFGASISFHFLAIKSLAASKI
ncbi:hypothetical protein GDO81_005923 [Engystomops pustulosus]|uniref:Uncharacterized protein n=1 Tax=Engystomops pustulosus TaxID=76066 RepID=A0AAV7CW00_ENGPU|nr:hypothetical protein GDO81_005923 [Engystomops pustulosus]